MFSSTLLFMSTQDIMVIMVLALVLFGGKKLPELARGLGQGIREFKDASEGVKRDIVDQINKEADKKEPVAPVQNTSPAQENPAPAENNHPRETPLQ